MNSNGMMRPGNIGKEDIEHVKTEAIRHLIESIDQGSSLLPISSTMPIAKRILESSIGGNKNTPSEISANLHFVDKSKKSDVILKKMQRSYRKNIPSSSHLETNAKMKQVEQLYKRLCLLEGEEVASDIMLLFRRLTGRADQVSVKTKSFGSRFDRNIVPKLSNEGPNESSMVGENDQVGIKHFFKPSTTVFSGIRSHKRVELAIQEEETAILRQCLRFLQNIEGQSIRFHHNSPSSSSNADKDVEEDFMENYEGMRIQPGLLPFHLNVETCVRHQSTRMLTSGSMDALRLCGEAGWLYSRIQSYITLVLDQRGGRGVVPRAFASTLTKELKWYHQLLASLERDLTQSKINFTVRRLVTQLRRPISQLRTMALLVDGISPDLNGGQLILALYLYSMHGNTRHGELVNRILRSTALPWYDLLYDWTMKGILSSVAIATSDSSEGSNSGNGEFFIEENDIVDDALMWHDRFILRQHQIPHVSGIGYGGGILNETLAREVLVVGKGINFIRSCLHDTKWTLDLNAIIPTNQFDNVTVDANQQTVKSVKQKLGFHYDGTNSDTIRDVGGRNGAILTQTPLERTVSVVARQVHRHILSSLFDHHHLLLHLYGLKEVLFLGQGDFICALMDGLHVEFDFQRGTDGIYIHSMMGVLQEALRTTNAKFLPRFVTDRIHVKLLPTNTAVSTPFWIDENGEEEKDGWDIFSLGYAIDAPLTAVVHPEAMKKYDRVFTLLFRLKRIEWMLNSTWRQSTVLNHALQLLASKYGDGVVGPTSSMKREREFSRMKLLLRKFSMTRQTMLHFVNNLQSYLMFEVLESGWKKLVGKLRNAKSLDEVISSHTEYLDEIVVKSLLVERCLQGEGRDAHNLGLQLRLVLTISYRFCKCHEKIFSEALQSIDKATEKRRRAECRINAGKWGFDSIDENENFYNLSDANKLTEIMAISDKFDAALRGLLSMLNDKINNVVAFNITSPSASSIQEQIVDKTLLNNNDALRFLTFRLDFSEYYSHRMTSKS